ncbi:MAG TPA: hypothetical protein VFM05_02730 [Candidatus Saccharimonadales bacterium]|nr:hypothetical protein [Candidatus Saccharimonadales bacterium]
MSRTMDACPEELARSLADTPECREIPEATYEEYRTFCNTETNAFRLIGIQNPDAYEAAKQDPRTVFCNIYGKRYPAATPIGYEARYEAERCQELTGKPDVLLLSIPLCKVYGGAMAAEHLTGGSGLSSDFAILVEEMNVMGHHRNKEADHQALVEALSAFGPMQANEFVHPQLETVPGHETAWMGIYGFSFAAKYEKTMPDEVDPDTAFETAWLEHCAESGKSPIPGEAAEGTYILNAEQLRQHPEIVDALWSISEVGFGKVLGAFHPISMEVTRRFFDEQIMADGIHTAVRYHEGVPVSFGFLALNMEHQDWIDNKSTVMQQEIQGAADRNETLVHVFELISNGPKGMSFSPDILRAFLEIAGRTGRRYRVLFESTNLSAIYIPKIATRQVAQSDWVDMSSPVRLLDKVDYWYLASQTPGEQ